MPPRRMKLNPDQLPLFVPDSDWKPTDPINWPDFRSHAKIIGLDTETHDPFLTTRGPGFIRGDSLLCGISLASEDGQKIYLPIAHVEDNYDRDTVLRYVKHQLGGSQIKTGANLTYDMESLHSVGITIEGDLADTQILEPLIDEEPQTGYSLNSLSLKYLGVTKTEDLLHEAANVYGVEAKKGMKHIPARFVAPYAEDDAYFPTQIYLKQIKVIEDENLQRVFKLEQDLQKVLFKMRLRGVKLGIDRAERVHADTLIKEKELAEHIKDYFGRYISVEAGEEIAFALKEKDGFIAPRTDKGNISVTNEWLDGLDSEGASRIRTLRKTIKMRRDFIEKFLNESVNGRVYTNWRQLRNVNDDETTEGTRSGRVASNNINFTQIPSRDPYWGKLIRSLFVADDGLEWVKADYSQQEPRILLHFSVVSNYRGAHEAAQRYIDDPSTDYHQLTADLIKDKTGKDIGRRMAKDINLGSAYGMGVYKLSMKLGIDMEQAKIILQAYHEGIPYAKLMEKDCIKWAERRGYVRTILGRRRRFKLWEPESFEAKRGVLPIESYEKAVELWGKVKRAYTHKALNSVVQGTAADQLKATLVELDSQGYMPQIQVYDEINGSYEPGAWKVVKEVMQTVILMRVPFLVDPEVGPSWGETSAIKE